MPGLEEVLTYQRGLWLLVRGDAAGLRFLDLGERGSLRSFWAILWCAPAILISWIWIRANYLHDMPSGTHAGSLYFFRLALSEACGWILPVLLTAAVTYLAGIGNRFNGLVACINWLSIPFSYANAVLIAVMVLLPGAAGLIAFLWLFLMATLVFAMERVFRALCGPNIVPIIALILVQIVPVIFLSDWIDAFLGISAP